MSEGKEQRSDPLYTPFPDLTGWRSLAVNRKVGATSSSIYATYQGKTVTLNSLKRVADRVTASEPEDLIIAAWIIVLIHLLSQQDDIDIHVNLYPSQQHIHLSFSGEKKSQYTIASLLGHFKEAKARQWQEEEEQWTLLADNAVSIDLSGSVSQVGKQVVASPTSKLLFSATVSDGRDQFINLSLQASPMIHNQDSAQLHLHQVASCLEYICKASPDTPALSLHAFPLELLAGDNSSPLPILDDVFEENLLYERFEHQMERIVSKHPEAIALDFRTCLDAPAGDESVGNVLFTYQELDRRATILGHIIQSHLKKKPYKNSTTKDTEIVALYLEKSPLTYLSILAVLKAGAAWCPIDTDWPNARREALLGKSGANLVLTAGKQGNDEVVDILPSTMSIIRLDTIDYSQNIGRKNRNQDVQQRGTSNALAYLIWTSGTTGLPKAVGIQHKSAVQALRALQRVIPYKGFNKETLRYLQYSAYNFDLMILDMFYTWGLGGTLCTSTRSMLLTNLIALSNTLEVTHTLLTPAVMAMTPRQSIPSLEVVINGGEKLSQVVADTWSVDCCLLNLYGPAEATLIAMSRRIPPDDQVKAPNIGRALATTSCHAVNERDEIVFKGAIGQLVLGGHQCALGYIGESDKTREKFIDHPQLGRIYKTGDLVRQLWNGDFEYLGRSDDQIKIHGIRIELLEINAIMRSAMKDVMDSETLLLPSFYNPENKDDDMQIVNFSVLPLGCAASGTKKEKEKEEKGGTLFRTDQEAVTVARHLIRFANEKLPSYMVPSLFIIVSSFPRTSSAKIDRQALQKELNCFDRLTWANRLVGSVKEIEADKKRSSNPQEEQIRLQISKLCGISTDAIGRHMPFPTLGLNSIKAITLSHRLQEIGLSVTIVDIVQYQTLATLVEQMNSSSLRNADRNQRTSKYLESFNHRYHSAVKRNLQQISTSSASLHIEQVLPVTPLQEALLSESVRDKSRYWLHRCYQFSSLTINMDQLQGAIQKVIDHVEILRTCFVEIGQLTTGNSSTTKDVFAQVVLSSCRINLEIMDKVEEDDHDWDRRVHQAIQKKLNLQAVMDCKPPVGFLIVKCKKQSSLIAILHHALYDQITLGLVEDAISQCYHNFSTSVFDLIKPFSFGLKHLITCNDEKEENLRLQEWKQLLSVYPKGHIVTFPNLSGKDNVSKDSTTTTTTSLYHRKTSITFDTVTDAARDLQTSIRPILQATWASIFCAHCDTTDVLFGDSVSGRNISKELDNVAGPILDTLPIPICVSTTYRKLINNLHNYHKEAISNQPVPLRHIRSMVEIPKEFPLFACVFIFEPPQEVLKMEKKRKLSTSSSIFESFQDFGISVEHNIAVEVSISSDGHLAFGMVAKDAIISSFFAESILAQWECAVQQAIKDPDSDALNFSELFFPNHLLSISQYHISASLETAQKVPVFSALGKWAKKTPDAVAVEFFTSLDDNDDCVKSTKLTKTYCELEQESRQVAQLLTNRMANKSVIAVSLPRSMDTYIVLLGILRAGMTYLPIDPSLPATRKTKMISISNATCLVCSSSTQWSLTELEYSTVILQVDSLSFINNLSLTNNTLCQEVEEIEMSTPAYIIFTSGSTGTPKGCVLTQRNLASTMEAFCLTLHEKAPGTLDQSTRFLARSVEAFDVAILEALLPLQVGGAIVTGPKEVILQDLKRAMQIMHVTHAAVVPSLFFSQGRRILPQDLPHIRALIVGGERIADDIIKTWASSHVPLLNAYGPTEACIGNSIARLHIQDSSSIIGKPFSGTRFLVLKKNGLKNGQKGRLRLALRGEVGELFIGGVQVGSYLDKQAQLQSFIQWNGHRLYKTGDEVRLRLDDVAEYLGRSGNNNNNQDGSSQIKIRGVRIELSEVDNTLMKVANISRFVTTRFVGGQYAYLVTFIATKASSQKDKEGGVQKSTDISLQKEAVDLLQKLKLQLPSYMVPRLIIAIDSIPLSLLSGKLDGKALEDWYMAHSKELLQSTRHYDNKKCIDRDLDEKETIVKEEITRLFEIDTRVVDSSTDIFTLGLDSLNVITLSGVLNKRGISVTVAHIMTHSTVEEIARGEDLHHHQQNVSRDRLDFTKQVKEESGLKVAEACPLLPLQESMITQTLAAAGGLINTTPRYINIVRLMCRRDGLIKKRLEQSIEDALHSHQIYKTVFVESQGKLLQAILEESPLWQLGEIDFEKHAMEDICASLHCKPPIRYCITSSLNEVYFALHHAIYDGASFASLLEEIQYRYEGKITLCGSKGDFLEYVKEMQVPSQEVKLKIWEKRLRETTVTPLPCLTGKKPLQDDSFQRQEVQYKFKTSLSQLQEIAQRERVTLQLLVLDTFARVYCNYIGQDQVLFGIVLGGRSTNLHQQVHGPCINTVPFCYQIQKQDWQKHIQMLYAEAISHQHVFIPALSRRLRIQGNLFNSLFSYLGATKFNDFFEEVSSRLLTEYPFAVEVQEIADTNQLELRAVFDSQHIPSAQVFLFLQQMEMLISSSSEAGSVVNSTDLTLLAIENEAPHIPDPSSFFLQRFQRQVEQDPNAVAFAFSIDFDLPIEETSYKRLDEISNQIASKLASSVQGDIIGILLKQCPDLYSILLGVWKAGKVYLPLDPSLPFERLEYMTSIAKPNLIISAKEHMTLADSLGCSLLLDNLLTDEQRQQQPLSTTTSTLATPLSPPATTLGGGGAAYIMFTSGSTGKPKGVQISHLSLASAIYSWSQILPYSRQSRMLQLASPGFDVFLFEVCMPLALGFSFASAGKEDLLNDLKFTFSKLQLTMADLPAVLASTIRPDQIIHSSLQKFDWLMSGGDVIEDGVIRRWNSHGLINAWGPTETTIGNTLGFVSETSSRYWVGRAYPTSSIYILDMERSSNNDDMIAFRGCIGEIAIGGPQVADGYVGNPELTKEKFITSQNGVRVYRTGDRGRLLIDGSLECLGRIDNGQVKVNSQRVELGEIEMQLKRQKGIMDALVLYIKHPEMQSKQLVAFLIVVESNNLKELVEKEEEEKKEGLFRTDQESAIHALASLSQAGNHLAPYMIPSFCLVLAGKRLPLTHNNKVDTKRVQLMFTQMTANEIRRLDIIQSNNLDHSAAQSGTTELEVELQRIVAHFCDIDEKEMERNVSFYRLGIDSISGYQLLKRLKEHKKFSQLSLRDILKAQSIVSLAKLIQSQQLVDDKQGLLVGLGGDLVLQMDKQLRLHCDVSSLCLSAKDRIVRLLPCSPFQEGLLLESLNSGLYVHHHLFKIAKGKLPFVMDALQGLVDSHDILRTSFHLINGQFVQAVHTDANLRLNSLIEVINVQDAISNFTFQNGIDDEADLAKPPFTVMCFPTSKERYDGIVVIDLVLHHALYDGETLEMMFAELNYRARGIPVKSRPKFELLLPHIMSRLEDEQFFVQQIGNCPSTLLGGGQKEVATALSRPCFSSRQAFKISTDTLANFASKAGVSVHIVTLFAFSKLLAHLAKQRDVIFAQLFSLRDAISEAEDIIGPALNIVLTRMNFLEEETVLNALSRLQAQDIASRDHRSASLAQILRQSKINRGGQAVEFDTLFDFQQSASSKTLDARSSNNNNVDVLTPWDIQEEKATQYTLNVQFRQQGKFISVTAVGDSTVFSQNELDGNLKLLEEILTLTVDDTTNFHSSIMPGSLTNLSSFPVRSLVPAKKTSQSSTANNRRAIHNQNWTKEQKSLVEVISELTKVEKESIDFNTSIAHLGLDSIMAIRIASLLRAKGFPIGVADILQSNTIHGISERMVQRKKRRDDDDSLAVCQSNNQFSKMMNKVDKSSIAYLIGVSPEQIEIILPLLPGQEFELSEYIYSKGETGIFTFLYEIKTGSVDKTRMEAAWKNLRARHDLLRTSFVNYKGEAYQVVISNLDDIAWKASTLHQSMSSLLNRNDEWSNWMINTCPIDMNLHQPPCAASLVSAPDGFFFILRLHHCLYDAWTIAILMKDLVHLYKNTMLAEAPKHSNLIQQTYSDKILLTSKAESYWKALLDGVSPCIVGATVQQSNHRTATLSVFDVLVGASNTDKKLRNRGIILGSAFIAAWSSCLLNIFQSHEKIAFGLYHRGRTADIDGIEVVASNCMNVLPLVIKRNDGIEADQLCKSIKHQMDEQVVFESTTSMHDILSWTQIKQVAWNTYLNLLWGEEEEQQQQQQDSISHLLEAVSIPEKTLRGEVEWDLDWTAARVCEMKSDVNVNLHWDRKKDSISLYIQYRDNVCSKDEVQQLANELISSTQAIITKCS